MRKFLRLAAPCVLAVLTAVLPAKPKHFDFDDDLVESDLVRPDDKLVDGTRNRRRESLIRVRTDFLRELIHSTDDCLTSTTRSHP